MLIHIMIYHYIPFDAEIGDSLSFGLLTGVWIPSLRLPRSEISSLTLPTAQSYPAIICSHPTIQQMDYPVITRKLLAAMGIQWYEHIPYEMRT